MEGLRCHVLRLANAEKTGARAQVLNESTLVLTDCMSWNRDHTERLRGFFPDVEISIHHNRRSLSNFSIHFHMGSGGRELRWYIFACAVMACCAYALINPPLWSGYGILFNL